MAWKCPTCGSTREGLDDGEIWKRLTQRERQVVRLLFRGNKVTEAARELGISTATARNHIKSTYKKLHVTSFQQMFAKLGGFSD